MAEESKMKYSKKQPLDFEYRTPLWEKILIAAIFTGYVVVILWLSYLLGRYN
jgi:hypothetical protein